MATSPSFDRLAAELRQSPRTWLVTGAAGFIGSHLLERLLRLGQRVVALDNFSTGSRANLDDVQARVGAEAWARCRFIQGDVSVADDARTACAGVDYVLHQAALGSVPRSIEDPWRSHASNVDGSLQLLLAARDARVRRFVYASSSSVYGDHPALPKVEANLGRPLSPYATTKLINELYADVFRRCYGIETVGLRYFNVFGARQNPDGAYAAVIPRWIASALKGEPLRINGDGTTSRDFCYIDNVVQANLLAATAPGADGAFNVACGDRTTLLELARKIGEQLARLRPGAVAGGIEFRPERAGDVRHSLADISRAQAALGYAPTHTFDEGLRETVAWYVAAAGEAKAGA